jgi:type VI secretion system FHA domain protein
VFLTLEILSGPSTASLPTRSHTFGIEGGRIGRAPDNEWPIPYEFIHSKHAGIRFFHGLFYVEKLGSNVVAVGNPSQDLKTGDTFPLMDGSRLYLDEFELGVKVSAEPPAVERMAMQPPPDFDERFTETGVHAPIPDLQSPLALGGEGGSRLDEFLRDRTPTPVTPQGRSAQVEHLDGIYDHMAIQGGYGQAPATPPPAADMFADGWDKTNFSKVPRSAPQPSRPSTPWTPPATSMPSHLPPQADPVPYPDRTGSHGRPTTGYDPNAVPPPRDRTGPGWQPPPAPAPYDRPANPVPPPYDRTGPGGAARPGYERTGPGWGPAAQQPPLPHVPARAAQSAYERPSANTGPVPRELAGLLASFGVDPALLAPGDLEVFGRALRQAVSGTITTLQNRSEMRARFRLSGTQMAHGDPNPLKVAPNLDDAMHEFFRRRQPGKMPLDVAVGSALEEVQWHQLAMLDAMEVAFNAVLDRLDPANVEEQADKSGRRGALSSRGAHLWETYAAVYRQLAADRGEAYRKYFGTDFSRAYDQALERRRNAARNTRR